MNRDLKVLLADDDPIILDGLSTVLATRPGIEVVAVARDGSEAMDAMTRYTVDVALLDVDMPGVDGVRTAEYIAGRYPGTTIVMLTAFEHDEFLDRALKAGAHGFLTKDIPVTQLADLIQQAHAGQTVMGPRPTQLLATSYLDDLRRHDDHADFIRTVEELPDHLRAVFDLLTQAMPNKTIASRLHLADSTVRIYVSHILTVTGCSSRAEVAIKAMKAGLSA